MRRIKYFALVLVILGGLFFLFGPVTLPEDFQPQEILNVVADKDVIIIFNSGGWGDTPLEKAEDFAPIIEGIQETLNNWGYNSVVIPYSRTKDDFWGKITGIKEFFNSFRFSSEDLAERIEIVTKNLPEKKIIIAGLSSGASFANETYGKISEEAQDSVYAIAAGTPFWADTFQSDNLLQLDNNKKDRLAKGDVKSLLLSLVKAPFTGGFQASGHDYSWSSPEVNSQIVIFLESKFR